MKWGPPGRLGEANTASIETVSPVESARANTTTTLPPAPLTVTYPCPPSTISGGSLPIRKREVEAGSEEAAASFAVIVTVAS